MRKTFLPLLLLLAVTFTYPQYKKEAKILDDMIQQGMADWKVPGLATVIVKDGEVVFKKTYGVKSIESKEPINDETLFAMASTTKAMVAMALGILVDEGKLHWDDKVVEHLPDFQLIDPYIATDARVKDLLTHNLGIANADMLWVLDSVSTKATLKRFRHTEKAYPLRGGFIYQNIMYGVAGEVIKAVSGKPWHEVVQKQLFNPLGMRRSQTQAINIHKAGNFTTPHYDFDENGVQIVERNYSDQIGAAGMMWSSIDDISNYLQFILNKGVHQGDTLIQPQTFKTLFQPHTLIPENQFYPTTKLTKPHWLSYGLGWFQHDYRGEKLDFHTGSLQGLVAIAGVIHEKNTAVYVFANLDHAELRHAILYKTMDLFAFGNGDRDWYKEIFELYSKMRKEGKEWEEKLSKERVQNTSPTLSLSNYAGSYHHPLCGQLTISVKNEKLHLNFNGFEEIDANHWHYNTFMTEANKRWTTPIDITFHVNGKAKVETLDFIGYTFTKNN